MITSTTNPLVKDIVRMRARRHRDRLGRFVIEGRRPLERAIRAGVVLERQVVCSELGGASVGDFPTVEMAQAPFRKASIRKSPDGVLAIAPLMETRLDLLQIAEGSLVLVIEALEKPGNLGAMLRTAAAVGVDAVLVCDPATDIHNPNVVRASQGALFSVPIGVGDLAEGLGVLSEAGLRLIATSPASTHSLWDCDLTGGVAVAVGSEADGLSSLALKAADEVISIPSTGRVDSLNASVAAAIVLFEAARQRGD